jgi:hypothetical protein
MQIDWDDCFWSKVHPEALSGCWLWHGTVDKNGYGKFGAKWKRAHRVAFERTVGAIPDGLCVCHRCDVPGCVNPDHLFLGTVAQNNADKQTKGRCNAPAGGRNGAAKFSLLTIAGMLQLSARGLSHVDIAGMLGVSRQHVSNVLSGQRRKREAELLCAAARLAGMQLR